MIKTAVISAKIGAGLALAFCSLADLAPAEAVTFTFDSGDDGLPTITKTVDGITMTINNFVADGTSTVPDVDGNGIYFGNFLTDGTDDSNVNSFDITFDADVLLDSYEIGFDFTQDSGRSFDLGASLGNTVNPDGIYDFNDPFVIDANTVINFVANGFITGDVNDGSQLRSITLIDSSSPPQTSEPLSLIALLGMGGLGFASRKQRV